MTLTIPKNKLGAFLFILDYAASQLGYELNGSSLSRTQIEEILQYIAELKVQLPNTGKETK